ncbi:unnamed protein product [Prorocentrum cordatum]|uniref:N-acetylglucosaminylphosphatidylinositol deacetylase n=1 Tax=Prorocentrum cordatum TaxID=2364126 RepID=A0ABN9S6C7_9DINO|nr:unnamed protein product [Polarella glacialis]
MRDGPLAGRRVALVVAHPDDEVMFFWPTLLKFQSAGMKISILCLSTGNADGLGDIRKGEMERSCARIGVLGDALSVLDVAELRDGFHEWPQHVVSDHVLKFVRRQEADLVLTFDDYGVSGHPNHISTSLGVRCAYDAAMASTGAAPFQVLMLRSVGLLMKYIGAMNLLLGGGIASYTCVNPIVCLQALAVHWSQLVWYRVLFALFSRYAFLNTYVQYGIRSGGADKKNE